MTGPYPPGAPLPAPQDTLLLLTRPDCELCSEMHSQLAALAARIALPPLQLLDVDSDRELQRRYGLKIPVLLLAGSLVCSTRLDEGELRAALAARPPPAHAPPPEPPAPQCGTLPELPD